MADDELLSLPLKSLELPSKTVAKLKPLGVRVVGDVYALRPAVLVGAGLVRKELEELAEAAESFGVKWASPDELAAALNAGADGQAGERPAKARKTPEVPKPLKSLALPADFVEAYAEDAPRAVDLVSADIDHFAPYVDDTGRNFQTPPPSPRHLRLIRRMRLVRSASIGGPEHGYLVALMDVSPFPTDRAAELNTFLSHVGNLVGDVVRRTGAQVLAHGYTGCSAVLGIAAKDTGRVARLVEEHGRWMGSAPMFSRRVPPMFEALAQLGVGALDPQD
ncbi:MAG: hypothetical protein ACOYM9_12085 [Bradymonadia bacterium]